MVKCVRSLTFCFLLSLSFWQSRAVDARFDLVGPRIDVRVTRGAETLPIASVPNLLPGDKIWLHPDLPSTQSVKYLLICVFLRGTTNPPPDEWFIRVQTWDKKVREEGVFVTVPPEAQQAVLFMAPETGGDFSTLKSAVRGRPGVFVRASQDLAEAGFEQARIEKYLASIRRVPPSDPADLQKHSDLLARTLALKPNDDCFKRSPDTQFTCLTQTGSQTLLDDGHGQTIAAQLSNGATSDFINQASYTRLAGSGEYSAYVGAIVDLVRLMGNLHTAQYQYIPAIAFPQAEAMNLRLNTPPSFHNPKSVLVIGLPSVQPEQSPPLRPADASHVTCMLKPSVVLPIEGAPLVFSTAFAHDLVLHLNTPDGVPTQPDIPLLPDAYQGGLVLQKNAPERKQLHEPTPLVVGKDSVTEAKAVGDKTKDNAVAAKVAEPVTLTGTIQGHWGFDRFTGPTLQLQQLPGEKWHMVSAEGVEEGKPELIAGHTTNVFLTSSGTACVHTISAQPGGNENKLQAVFHPLVRADQPNLLGVTLPLEHGVVAGDLHLAIQQYGQPKADEISTRTFEEPAQITSVELRARDKYVVLNGTKLSQVERVKVGDLNFKPAEGTAPASTLRLALPDGASAPPTKADDHLTADIILHDGRILPFLLTVSAPRPSVSLLRKSADPTGESNISLGNAEDIPLSAHLTFTLKSPQSFPRNGRVEVETLDGTLRTVLTLAPSGGLLLQDPHTVVATLDPLRSFGPSAFGPIHLRAVFPSPKRASEAEQQDATPGDAMMSDWLPLATLVRLPTLTHIQCPSDTTQQCTLTGLNLFLLQSVSADPGFANPSTVPDGFTGTTLGIPHPSASTLFFHLRDDPAQTNSAIVPAASSSSAVSISTHAHGPHS